MTMRDLRRNYDMKALEREDLAAHPVNQFHKWFEEARDASPPDWLELNAMTLSTYDQVAQQITSRIVLLKHLDERGFMFLYQLRFGQGHAAQPTSASQPRVLLAAHGAASTRAGASIKDRSRDQRTLFPFATLAPANWALLPVSNRAKSKIGKC